MEIKTPKPTRTPKPTKTPTPKPTKTPKPTRTPHGTDELIEIETPKPTKTPKPTRTPEVTNTPEITATPYREPEETATPKPTKTPKPGHGGGNYGHGVEGLIKAAESRVGCPYVRGGKGPDSFDCSGLVYWCLKQAGVNISYMTSVRWRTCSKFTRIDDMDKLKKGDILVFSGSSESSGHVGIYIGSGRMIDASSSAGSVVKRSVSTKYWTNHFLMAYRIW